MFVPVPNAFGTALITIQALDNVITVDPGLYAQLEAVLGQMGADHTYLKIGEYPYLEYVKVTGVSNIPNQLVVTRGIDNTNPQLHAANTRVEYILTHAAVQDTIDIAAGFSVTLTGTGIAEVNPVGTNNFEIFVPDFPVISSNQSIIVEGPPPGEYGTWDISVNPEMFGVCRSVESGGEI